MTENSIKIILEAADKTQAAFKQLEGNATSCISKIRAHWLELTAAGAGIYGLIRGLTSFVNEAAQAEQIERRMAFQVEAAGYQFKTVKPLIDQFANSTQNATRFSDELAREGLGKMMQYTVDLEAAMKGLRLAMDMSTQTGQDLDSCVRLIGMAMNGNVEILGRWIPELRDINTKLGENATAAEKSAYAFDVLNKKFSGAAQADIKTYTGQAAQLKNEWSDFKEMIGEQLIPRINSVTELLKKMAKAGMLWLGGAPEKDRLLRNLAETEEVIERIERKRSKTGQIPIFHRVEYEQQIKKRIDLITKLFEFEEKIDAARKANIPDKPEAITPPEPDWVKNWVKDWDALTYSFEKLGIESQASLAKAAQAAITYKDQIKIAFDQGKASVLDYANAVKSLTEIYKKLGGEDIYKKLNENEENYLENVKRLNEQYPDRGQEYQKALNKIIDGWLKTKTEIEEKDPAFIRANLAKWEADLNEAANLYKTKFLSQIQPVDLSGGGGGSAGGGSGGRGGGYSTPPKGDYGGSWDANLKNKLATIPANVNFTATGMSPKMPLGDALSKLVDKFGGIAELISGLEAEISFDKVTVSLKQAEKELAKYTKAYNDFYAVMSRQWSKPEIRMFEGKGYTRDEFYELMQDALGKVDILKKEQMLSLLQGSGSFQTGGRVGATGLYILHKGEEVRTTNQVSMDGMTVNVTIPGAGDANDLADKFVKILKYRLKGELKDLIS